MYGLWIMLQINRSKCCTKPSNSEEDMSSLDAAENDRPTVPVATTCDQEEVQRWSPYRSMRKGHNKENQLDPEEAERNNRTTPTSRDKEGQAEGIPEAEKISNNIARREHKERSVPNSTLLESK
ncbi:hypothetical protein TNCV_1406381 [Trichonephila clavipes]|nr:hypothetical protein TNCV_1406381 [Trichonephila clavipes]